MSKKIGLITEDRSDVEVISKILEKYTAKNNFSIKPFVGNGCGKLKQKCIAWADMLFKSGCDFVFLFHDLDSNNINTLKKELQSKICPKRYPNSLIVIPVEEIEAWLLSDSLALKNVFNLAKTPPRIFDCEVVNSPKEYLGKLIWEHGHMRYINTVHNGKIAAQIELNELKRCSSFTIFDQFINEKVFV